MKTSCFTLLLLLLWPCCPEALPHGTRLSAAPGNCCFKMYDQELPRRVVAGIQSSHRSCRTAAFIVKTVRGREICYSQRFPWAQEVFNQHHGHEGSTQ